MKKKIFAVVLVVVLLALCAAAGYLWYRNAHVFIEDAVYKKDSQSLDLRGTDISLDHYLQLRQQLPGCQVVWDVPFQGKKISSDSQSIAITFLSEEDLEMLRYFPQLTTVDATDCPDYTMLENLGFAYPELKIAYRVDLGGQDCDPEVTDLILEEGTYTYETLMGNLVHLPNVESIHLPKTTLNKAQLEEINLMYPGIALTYTIPFRDQELDPGITELNLSDMTPEEIPLVTEQLGFFHGLEYVELMDENGKSQLSLLDVQALQESSPGTTFHYTFVFYKKTLSTTDTEVEYRNMYMKDSDEETIRQILDVMDNCTRFCFNNCHISNEVMAGIREDYRGRIKIVWRVFFGNGCSCLTDREVIKAVYGLYDSNSKALMYCEDARFIDFGHNDTLTDISFVRYMPNLEAIILSGSMVSDLSPFEGNTSIYFLELSNCTYLKDISPLATCPNLGMLNISYTQVTSLEPIMDLELDRLKYVHCNLSAEDVAEYQELHPDSWVSNTGHEYGVGWRYEEDGSQSDYYKMLASPEIFNYGGNTTDTLW